MIPAATMQHIYNTKIEAYMFEINPFEFEFMFLLPFYLPPKKTCLGTVGHALVESCHDGSHFSARFFLSRISKRPRGRRRKSILFKGRLVSSCLLLGQW